jgi:hypothetical protein
VGPGPGSYNHGVADDRRLAVDEVRLPDLETIRRFSIAVRSEHAPAEEVIEALRTDLERIEGALRGRRPASASPARNAPKKRTSRATPR